MPHISAFCGLSSYSDGQRPGWTKTLWALLSLSSAMVEQLSFFTVPVDRKCQHHKHSQHSYYCLFLAFKKEIYYFWTCGQDEKGKVSKQAELQGSAQGWSCVGWRTGRAICPPRFQRHYFNKELATRVGLNQNWLKKKVSLLQNPLFFLGRATEIQWVVRPSYCSWCHLSQDFSTQRSYRVWSHQRFKGTAPLCCHPLIQQTVMTPLNQS